VKENVDQCKRKVIVKVLRDSVEITKMMTSIVITDFPKHQPERSKFAIMVNRLKQAANAHHGEATSELGLVQTVKKGVIKSSLRRDPFRWIIFQHLLHFDSSSTGRRITIAIAFTLKDSVN